MASYNNNEEAPHEPDGVALVWNMKYKKTTPEYVFHCQVRWPFNRLPMLKDPLVNVDKCLFSFLVNMMMSLDWHLLNHSIFANRCQTESWTLSVQYDLRFIAFLTSNVKPHLRAFAVVTFCYCDWLYKRNLLEDVFPTGSFSGTYYWIYNQTSAHWITETWPEELQLNSLK